MRILVIATLSAALFATGTLAMGKKDATTQDTQKQIAQPDAKPAVPAAKPAVPAGKPAAPAEKPAADRAVVTINGKPIMTSTVEAKLAEALQEQLGRMMAGGANLPPEAVNSMRERMRKDIIESMVTEQLVDEKLKADKIEVTDKDVDARIEMIRDDNNMTMEQIEQELAKDGVTIEAFRADVRHSLRIEKLLDKEMAAAGEPGVTDADVRKYYDENTDRFSTPEQVRASHILIKTEGLDDAGKAEAKKKIEDLLAKARAGEDFAALAREHSEDPGSKARGGEYVFPRGQMVKPFEDAALALESGQISDVVETQFGYHIIKLSEKLPAKTASFDEVQIKLKRGLEMQKRQQFWPKFREKLKNEAKMEWSAEDKARMDAAEQMMRPPVRMKP